MGLRGKGRVMKKHNILVLFIIILPTAIAGCNNGDDGVYPIKCTQNICLDANTLLYCDQDSGSYIHKNCECNMETNSCKGEPPTPSSRCDKDICMDAQHLSQCNIESGISNIVPCNQGEICTFGQCEQKSFDDYTCTEDTEPTCIGDTMYMVCDDIPGDNDWKPVFHHCTENRKCKDGKCILTPDEFSCQMDVCKDIKTLNKCLDGQYTEYACQSNELCIHGSCVDSQGIKTCQTDTDCGDNQIFSCHMNICYHKSTFELAVGAPCDMYEFEEYCKDGLEYKCGYSETVEVVACNAFNGCSLYIKPAYMTEKPTLNAICRGTTEELRECSQPGSPAHYCYMYTDTEFDGAFSFSYNIQNQCIVGTDGQMIYTYMEIQNDCHGENMCNNVNGLCF